MADFNVANRVQELCKARSWSLYRLAHEADMPYSTLNTVLYKTVSPSLVSIEKLCNGFGITLSQFFSEENEQAKLTADERACLSRWAQIGSEDKRLVFAYMQALIDRRNDTIIM